MVRGVERAKTDGASLAHIRTAGTDGCDSWRNNFLFVMAAICRCPNIRTHHLIASSFTSRFVTDYVTSLRMIMFEHKQEGENLPPLASLRGFKGFILRQKKIF